MISLIRGRPRAPRPYLQRRLARNLPSSLPSLSVQLINDINNEAKQGFETSGLNMPREDVDLVNIHVLILCGGI